jgi:hypothetical protein
MGYTGVNEYFNLAAISTCGTKVKDQDNTWSPDSLSSTSFSLISSVIRGMCMQSGLWKAFDLLRTCIER